MKVGPTFPFTPQLYTNFAGINTTRSDVSMERPDAQPFIEMDNLYCHRKGYLSNEQGLTKLGTESGYISHVRYLDERSDVFAYAVKTPGGTSLRLNGTGSVPNTENIWPRNASVCSVIFNHRMVLAAGQTTMRYFDGFSFKEITSPDVKGAKYLCVVQGRLCVAGIASSATMVKLSHVNDGTLYTGDEDPGSPNVLNGANLDVTNFIGNGEVIRGLGAFEADKLAIFTSNRIIVYAADPDYTKWALDSSIIVKYGTVSHKSIVSVGDEVYFCSRAGVHSMRRSMLNGINVFANPMSEDIVELYQKLLAQVTNTEDISAYFNSDEGRLHIFFPINDKLCYRLSAALTVPSREIDSPSTIWSLSTFNGLTCGDYLAGKSLCGSVDGLHLMKAWYDNTGLRGNGSAKTPILWHKDLFRPKTSMELVLYAAGAGKVYVDAWDESNRSLGTFEYELPDGDQADYYGEPLQRQWTRPFTFKYIGVRFNIRVESTKLVRIFGIGVLTKGIQKGE